MELYWTRHARNRLRLYDISQAAAQEVLAKPNEIVPEHSGYQNAWGQSGERWLRITFKDEGNRWVIITVTPKRKKPGG